MSAAESADFTPVLIYNGTPSNKLRSTLAALAPLVERPNYGHDFGAYREVVLALSSLPSDPHRSLILANDSIFYPDDFADIFRGVVDLPSDVTSITASRSPRFHLQSYFLCLTNAAIHSPELAVFWQRYKPTSVRSRVIRRGELQLSRAIHRSPLSMQAYVDTRAVAESWFGAKDAGADPDRLADLISPKFHDLLDMSDLAQTDQLVRVVSTDRANPTHVWGLILHQLLGIPVKKDLWKSVPTIYLFPELKHYSKDQLQDIAAHMDEQVATFNGYGFLDLADFVAGNK